MPTLTPILAAGVEGGTWEVVKGADLVSPIVIAVPAGDGGVLLLRSDDKPWSDGRPCERPGRDPGGSVAAFFDPTTGTIRKVSGRIGLEGYAAASLPDGRVLVAGGYEPGESRSKPTRRTRIWDPRTEVWSEGGRMRLGRGGANLAPLPDGRVLAVGGWVTDEECDSCETETQSTEIYDPATNLWSEGPSLVLEMPDEGGPDQLESVTPLADGRLLARGANASASVYDPASGVWTGVTAPAGWSTPIPLPDGTALSFGVEWFGVDLEDSIPFAGVYVDGRTRIVGHWAAPDYAAITVLPDGRVFIAGGVVENASGYLGDFLTRATVFDPATGAQTQIAPMPIARAASEVTPLSDGSVLVIGGVDVWETQRAGGEEPGNDTPGCVPVASRVLRWTP